MIASAATASCCDEPCSAVLVSAFARLVALRPSVICYKHSRLHCFYSVVKEIALQQQPLSLSSPTPPNNNPPRRHDAVPPCRKKSPPSRGNLAIPMRCRALRTNSMCVCVKSVVLRASLLPAATGPALAPPCISTGLLANVGPCTPPPALCFLPIRSTRNVRCRARRDAGCMETGRYPLTALRAFLYILGNPYNCGVEAKEHGFCKTQSVSKNRCCSFNTLSYLGKHKHCGLFAHPQTCHSGPNGQRHGGYVCGFR